MRIFWAAGVVCGAIFLTGGGGSVRAQQTMACHSMDAGDAPLAPEKLPPPVRMTGIGNSSMEITSSSAEAKMWFEQGLNLLHDFWDYESARAFEQSIRLDPKCAMCYWGLSQAEAFRGDSKELAHDSLKQAKSLKKNASAAEKLYIEAALEGEKEANSKKKPKEEAAGAPHVDSQETKTLRKLVAMKPGDVQARIFLSGSLRSGFDKKGEPKAGTVESQAILKAILVEHPDDTAANHYWIHAVEPGQHPELALESAKKLGPLTPASGHMVHMPGHIFYRTGDYETARLSFENSMHVDEAYMKAQQVSVANDWNYVHNMMYLIADLLEAGRMSEATAVSAKLNTARGEHGGTLYRGNVRDGLTRLNPELPVLLRSANWVGATEALKGSAPAAELVNLAGLRASMLDYTQGMAALEAGNVQDAASFSADLDERMKVKTPEEKDSMPGMSMSKDAMAKPVHSFMDVAAMELKASVLLAQGKQSESEAMYVKAAEAEAALGYREPPYYIRPVGETRGDGLMRAGRYAEAKKAYEAALVERPNSGYPLYGIALADVAAKDTAAATADYAKLMKAWSKADTNLSQIKDARSWMAGHGGSAEGGH